MLLVRPNLNHANYSLRYFSRALRHTKGAVKRKSLNKKSSPPAEGSLTGWTAIARYLGIPIATAHRWASEGMPVRREGRFTVADREALSAWLGRESHMPKPAHVMTADADLAAALKESIAAVRNPAREQKNQKSKGRK